jgi:hypothetical protein
MVVDCMGLEEAQTVMDNLKTKNPDVTYLLEEYNWHPDANRMGRDPDLH